MLKVSRWIWISFAVIFGLAAALIYAAKAGWWGLKLNGEVKTIEVLTLAVNLMIAWALQNFLVSRISNQRAEKDFLIEIVKDAQYRVKDCNERFYQCVNKSKVLKADFDFLKAACRNLANVLEQIEISIGKSDSKHLSPKYDGLKKTFYEYKAVLTDVSPNRAYRPEATGEHLRANRALFSELQDLVFEINRM
jgi:hypothetical protein